MITDRQLKQTLEGESAPKCVAANGGIPCNHAVVKCSVVFLQPLWFCQKHWDERAASDRVVRAGRAHLIRPVATASDAQLADPPSQGSRTA